ncbi:MAG: ABC transporter ATP-binding protein [Selenomonadaceae bacterium]|nr:ABC transporter ATP-binding protein [Selenomonadaceae bacterium]
MIELRNIVKRYNHKGPDGKNAIKTAVNGLSLTIEKGEIFGLLGPNGAGKTTTVRMLTTLTQPSEGEILYDGIPLKGNEGILKRKIGVVPQNLNFDQDLTAGENLELHARLYHLPKEKREKRIKELLDFVELEDVINDSVRKLSGGMKRRLLIARGLIHEPDVLFMDEPTVALDPQVRRRIWELIRQMARKGTTVLLTTHYIEEAAALCDRVAIMKKGSIIELDTPQGFIDHYGHYMAEWEGANGTACRFFSAKEEAEAFVETMTIKANVRPATLEDVFVEITGRREGLDK